MNIYVRQIRGTIGALAAICLILVAGPATAQQERDDSALPVPGMDEQLSAQQSPLAPSGNTAPAPSQETLPPASSPENAVIQSMRAKAQQPDEPDQEQAADGDALPDVRNVRLTTEGMDYTADNTVDLELRDTPVDVSDEQYQQGIREEAFDAATTGLFPMRPDEIKEILRQYDETRKAVEEPHYTLPTPEVKVETISLDPGVTPPVIQTAVGHVTTLTLLDVTGAPWPIQDVSWAGDFEVIEPEEGGHIIRITPMANFAYGNVSMRLLTLKTPITFTLRTSRDEVQYRFDARIPEYGPMAEAPLIEGGKQIVAGDNTLTQILDGLTPKGAERLDVSGVDGRTTAVLIGGTTYLRTPLTLLSPAWDSSVKSADGMHVYAMAETPVVLLSDGGKFRRATLRAREGLFDE